MRKGQCDSVRKDGRDKPGHIRRPKPNAISGNGESLSKNRSGLNSNASGPYTFSSCSIALMPVAIIIEKLPMYVRNCSSPDVRNDCGSSR